MKLVTIRTFDNYFLANIILTRLHAAGVECYLRDEYTVTVDPIISNAIGGIKLEVRKEHEAATVLLLQQFDREYLEAAICPRCGSSSFLHIAKPAPVNYLTALLTWIFSSYAVAPEWVYRCQNCGYENERLPEAFRAEELHQN